MKKLLLIMILMIIPITCHANDRMMYMGEHSNIMYFVDIDSYTVKDDGHVILGIMINDKNTGIVGAFVYDVNTDNRTYKPLSAMLIINGKMSEEPVNNTTYTMNEGSMIEKAVNIIIRINNERTKA